MQQIKMIELVKKSTKDISIIFYFHQPEQHLHRQSQAQTLKLLLLPQQILFEHEQHCLANYLGVPDKVDINVKYTMNILTTTFF